MIRDSIGANADARFQPRVVALLGTAAEAATRVDLARVTIKQGYPRGPTDLMVFYSSNDLSGLYGAIAGRATQEANFVYPSSRDISTTVAALTTAAYRASDWYINLAGYFNQNEIDAIMARVFETVRSGAVYGDPALTLNIWDGSGFDVAASDATLTAAVNGERAAYALSQLGAARIISARTPWRTTKEAAPTQPEGEPGGELSSELSSSTTFMLGAHLEPSTTTTSSLPDPDELPTMAFVHPDPYYNGAEYWRVCGSEQQGEAGCDSESS